MWYFRVKLFPKSVQTCGLLDNRHGCRVKYVHPQRLVGSIETDIGGLIGRANTWISPNRIARLFGTFSATLRKFCKSFIGLLSFHFQNPFVKPSGSFRFLNFTSFITSSNPSQLARWRWHIELTHSLKSVISSAQEFYPNERTWDEVINNSWQRSITASNDNQGQYILHNWGVLFARADF